MIYFAYGSNMNLMQMRSRCPASRKIGNAVLYGYEICFPRKSSSRQGKGVASICENSRSYIEGVLFELTSSDLDRLDELEGVPHSYTRKPIKVLLNDGREIIGETYFANSMEGNPFRPSKKYMEIIIQGAIENELSKDYIEKLKQIECENG